MNSRSKILTALRESCVPDETLPAIEGPWTTYSDPRQQFVQVLESVGGRTLEVAAGDVTEGGLMTLSLINI